MASHPLVVAKCFQDVFSANSTIDNEVVKLGKYMKEISSEKFMKEFIDALRQYLTLPAKCSEATRVSALLCKFMTSQHMICNSDTSQQEKSTDFSPYFGFIISAITSNHNAHSKDVRIAVCGLVAEILDGLPEDCELDESLTRSMIKSLTDRLFDKFPKIRQKAVYALARLQDSSDPGCHVIRNYIRLVQVDVNFDVRKAVLERICLNSTSLPMVVDRLRDSNKSIRCLVYNRLGTSVGIKHLSIDMRVAILGEGIDESDEEVKNSFKQFVLHSWFNQCESSLIQLVDLLICDESQKYIPIMLKHFLNDESLIMNYLHEITQLFYSDRKIVDLSKTSRTTITVWSYMIEHEKRNRNYDALDCLLPELTEFCQHLMKFVKENCVDTGESEMGTLQDNIAVAEILFGILLKMDRSDEGGRKFAIGALLELLAFPKLPIELVEPTVKSFEYFKLKNEIIEPLAETIAEILQPINSSDPSTSQATPTSATSNHSSGSDFKSAAGECDGDKENHQQMAKIRIEIISLKARLDDALENEKYEDAAHLKQELHRYETERRQLAEREKELSEPVTIKCKSICSDPTNDVTNIISQVSSETVDPTLLRKCLVIASSLLRRVKIDNQSSILSSLTQSLILPSIQNTVPEVRESAVKCLGLMCIRNKSLASKYLVLLTQIIQVDVETVQITAMQAIFDILMAFGVDCLRTLSNKSDQPEVPTSNEECEVDEVDSSNLYKKEKNSGDDNENESSEELANTANSLLTVMSGFLDHDNPEIRFVAIEGIVKLLLLGRISSNNLLARLILMWFNPVNSDDRDLCQCLAAFFPLFACASTKNQELVTKTATLCIKAIFSSAASSPLRKIRINSICDFFVELTSLNCRLLVTRNVKNIGLDTSRMASEPNCHDLLAMELIKETLESNDVEILRAFTRMLSLLQLTTQNTSFVSDLLSAIQNLQPSINDRLCLKYLEKLKSNLILHSQPDQNLHHEDTLPVCSETSPNIENTTMPKDKLPKPNKKDAKKSKTAEKPSQESIGKPLKSPKKKTGESASKASSDSRRTSARLQQLQKTESASEKTKKSPKKKTDTGKPTKSK